ncbi:hypothetical protein [Streptacidiphilus sp. MAP5-3]
MATPVAAPRPFVPVALPRPRPGPLTFLGGVGTVTGSPGARSAVPKEEP